MNDFFKHGNKVYIENLNDSVLVGNAFSWSISIDLPTDSDGLFPTGSDVVKAKVADVYATPNSSLSIGDTISNSSGSSQVYRLTVYPSFNRFGGFTFVSLEGDGSVIITTKGGTSPVRNNLDYSNLGNITELKTLREYDLVVTIPSGGEVTGLGFGFQSTTGGANASISQENVSGLVDDLSSLESGKANVSHLHTTANVASSDALVNIGTSAGATQRMINDAIDEKVGSLSTSITNLIQVQDVTTSQASCQPNYSIDRTATVSPCPSGYSALFIPRNSYRSVTRYVGLQGTTARFNVTNISNSANNVGAYGWLVYYPSTWNI